MSVRVPCWDWIEAAIYTVFVLVVVVFPIVVLGWLWFVAMAGGTLGAAATMGVIKWND